MKIVCDSSILITLENAGVLHIIKDLFGEIVIPQAVKGEVFRRRELPSYIRSIEISQSLASKVLESNLEPGESEAICLYEEIKADLLIIDDLEGRKFAERLEINISGTLGILLLAKQKKLIDKVKPILDRIVSSGFRISVELYKEILRKAKESC